MGEASSKGKVVKVRLDLSAQAEKYVRRDSPVGARRMAARGALPLEPVELATVLFALVHDPDEQVKATARDSLESLPPHVLDTVLSANAHPALLSMLAKTHRDDEARCQKLALNPAADDLTIAFLASLPFRAVVDIVSNNQERMLRCEEIVEALGANPLTGRAVIERILGFLGIQAREEDAALVSDDAVSDDDAEAAVFALLGGDGAVEDLAKVLLAENADSDDDLEEDIRNNLFAAIQNMTVMQKVKLARLGGNEARSLLIRDRNKVVASAAISSPKITDSEVVGYAQSRAVSDEVLRVISSNREWTRNYQVKLGLVMNPKCPQPAAIQFLNYVQDRDLKTIMKSKDVPSVISAQARRILQKKGKI